MSFLHWISPDMKLRIMMLNSMILYINDNDDGTVPYSSISVEGKNTHLIP